MKEVQIEDIRMVKCVGQYDSPWMEGFVPAWKILGLKNIAEGFVAALKNLQKHKDNIISVGFSKEVLINMGADSMILKGQNKGRKKDL